MKTKLSHIWNLQYVSDELVWREAILSGFYAKILFFGIEPMYLLDWLW